VRLSRYLPRPLAVIERLPARRLVVVVYVLALLYAVLLLRLVFWPARVVILATLIRCVQELGHRARLYDRAFLGDRETQTD
jgi:hypothetical protein